MSHIAVDKLDQNYTLEKIAKKIVFFQMPLKVYVVNCTRTGKAP